MSTSACADCGCELARDHGGERCSPCARARTTAVGAPLAAPHELWTSDEARAAIEARHFGRLIHAYRNAHKPVLGQAVVAQWLGLTQGQISRIERAAAPVTDLSKLTRWATILCIPSQYLWFQLDSDVLEPQDSTRTIEDMNDLSRRTVLRTIGLTTVAIGSTSRVNVPDQPYTIGAADVEIIREMTTTFRRLDNRFGGGHSLALATNYLSANVLPMLYAGSRSTIRRDLLAATAELHHLVGWMLYDVGDIANGRANLRHALQLCQEARNDALAAEMLAGMSHQASFTRSSNSAVDLALAAPDLPE